LGESGDESTCIPSRIQFQQEVALGFQGEHPVGIPTDMAAEKGLDPPPDMLASQGEPSLFGIETPNTPGTPVFSR
jgi:hypothetical protein